MQYVLSVIMPQTDSSQLWTLHKAPSPSKLTTREEILYSDSQCHQITDNIKTRLHQETDAQIEDTYLGILEDRGEQSLELIINVDNQGTFHYLLFFFFFFLLENVTKLLIN